MNTFRRNASRRFVGLARDYFDYGPDVHFEVDRSKENRLSYTNPCIARENYNTDVCIFLGHFKAVDDLLNKIKLFFKVSSSCLFYATRAVNKKTQIHCCRTNSWNTPTKIGEIFSLSKLHSLISLVLEYLFKFLVFLQSAECLMTGFAKRCKVKKIGLRPPSAIFRYRRPVTTTW